MAIVLIIVLLIGILLILAALQKKSGRLRQIAQGLLVSYMTIIFLLLAGEAYFRFFHAESTGYFSLSQVNWINRYYQENSLGYRDREWQSGDFQNQEVITVIGDSFTAGSGISNPEDRYTDVLAGLLGEEYRVINLGLPGSSTPQQLEALENYPLVTANIVIWQYFLNDIEYSALQVSQMPPIEPPPLIIQESYLLNYLYFRLSPPRLDYWAWLYSCYDNSAIWDLHHQEIDAVLDYVESLEAELIVLVYPNMIDPVGSIPYVDRVAQAIETRGHTRIIKLFDVVAAWPDTTPLILSSQDAHPSIEFNHYVANTLYDLYFNESSTEQ